MGFVTGEDAAEAAPSLLAGYAVAVQGATTGSEVLVLGGDDSDVTGMQGAPGAAMAVNDAALLIIEQAIDFGGSTGGEGFFGTGAGIVLGPEETDSATVTIGSRSRACCSLAVIC